MRAAAVRLCSRSPGRSLLSFSRSSLFGPRCKRPAFASGQNFTWFTFGEQALRIGWVLDPLAAAMLVMITLVGLCIFVFSIGYMATDQNFTRFFAYLSFFSAAMLGVVIANSLLLALRLLGIGWARLLPLDWILDS